MQTTCVCAKGGSSEGRSARPHECESRRCIGAAIVLRGSICSAALGQSGFRTRECAIFSRLARPLRLLRRTCRCAFRAVTVASGLAVDGTKCAWLGLGFGFGFGLGSGLGLGLGLGLGI